jgi:hypothetical protein
VVDGVYRLDEGAVLDDFCHFLDTIGVMALLSDVHGTAIQRAMVPFVQYVLLYSLKTRFGIESINALPALLCSDEALMPLVGFNAQQARDEVCQRGTAKRQSKRAPGPICPDTLAKNIVKWNVRELEAVVNGAIRALAKAGVFRAKVTGIAEGTDLETTERYMGCGQVTRTVRIEDKQDRMHEIEVTVYGWKVLLPTVRHGQGKAAWTARLETEVVGIVGLTTYDQYGTPEHGRQQHRRDFQANPINAVVVRQWNGKDYGPGGKTVFLTNASVEQPLKPFDAYDDRSLIENCCIKEAKQQWALGHPPQKTARAVRMPVMFTLLMFALATGYRLPCEREAMEGGPVGWQRWWRQLLEQTRDKVIVFAQGYYGIFHLAEYSLLLGVRLKDMPPGIGTRSAVLAKYDITARS